MFHARFVKGQTFPGEPNPGIKEGAIVQPQALDPMTGKAFSFLLILALLAFGWAPRALADFAAGAEAYDGGDYLTAIEEWHPLAEEGNAQAQLALASLYQFGEGVPKDDAKAAKWYWHAAEQGELVAQINLAKFYAEGRGVRRDAVLAYMWFDLAAREGHPDAREAREALARDMAPWQIDRGRELADSWQPKTDPALSFTPACGCTLRHSSVLERAE